MKAQSLFSAKDFVHSATDPSLLFVRDQQGGYRTAKPDEIIDAARAAVDQIIQRGFCIDSPECSARILRAQMATRDHEVFACLFLDNKHRVIAYEELFFGTIDSAAVHPRQVVKRSLHHNAAAVVFCHNHPSGIPDPSQSDIAITQRLKEALALVDVRSIDHIIIGGSDFRSLAKMGYL